MYLDPSPLLSSPFKQVRLTGRSPYKRFLKKCKATTDWRGSASATEPPTGSYEPPSVPRIHFADAPRDPILNDVHISLLQVHAMSDIAGALHERRRTDKCTVGVSARLEAQRDRRAAMDDVARATTDAMMRDAAAVTSGPR